MDQTITANSVREDMINVVNHLNSINEENFNEEIKKVNFLLRKNKDADKVIDNPDLKSKISDIKQEIKLAVEEISVKLDTIVKEKQIELKIVEKEINRDQNKKRLNSYHI